jgi:parallel beta-helix repeat protein
MTPLRPGVRIRRGPSSLPLPLPLVSTSRTVSPPKPRWWRRVRFFEVVLFTAPPLLLALYFLGAATLDYHRLTQFDDWWSRTAHVQRFLWFRLRSAWTLPAALRLDQRLTPEDNRRALVNIAVDEGEWERFQTDPAMNWGEGVEALVVEDPDYRSGDLRTSVARGDLHKVELRPRGDTSVHWTSEKKTLSIKTSRGKLYKGNRTTVFSCKEVLPSYIANSLAEDFGLFATPTAVVPVFLNNRFYGMFREFAPPDETFLRRHQLIPGNIFRGDTAERGEYFKGLPRELFLNPYIWDRVAKNDRPGAIGDVALRQFIASVNSSTFEEFERLESMLDRGELAKLLALELVVGDPYHMSGVHNQFWYEDSSSGKLHPLPWDLRLLELQHPPPGSNLNRFWRSVLRDPRIFADAMRVVSEWLEDDKLYRLAEARVTEIWNTYRDGFEFDRLRAGVISDVGEPQEVLRVLRHNLDELGRWTRDARVAYQATRLRDDLWILDCVIEGRIGVVLTELDVGGVPCDIQLFADVDSSGVEDQSDLPVAVAWDDSARPKQPWRVLERLPLLPGCAAGLPLTQSPLHYRFFAYVTARPGAPPVTFLQPRFADASSGADCDVRTLEARAPIPGSASWHPWRMRPPSNPYIRKLSWKEVQASARKEPPQIPSAGWHGQGGFQVDIEAKEMRLRGEVHLEADLFVPEGTTLVVEPGTTVVLDPDVSILSRGRTRAEGTDSQPIVFRNAAPDLPWGSLALQGGGANDSSFEHCRFTGGGGALLENVEYTGMVCVHWARARFENCEFTANMRCDDALHVDKGEVDVVSCWLHDTNADALDYDMSGGEIRDCKIERARNDGLDLMTCWPRIIGNTIQDSGDKGISIGEASTPLVLANRITGCNRGIEVKDSSEPVLVQNEITGNKVGVMARLKNWRYDRAGWPKIVRSVVTRNGQDLDLEKGSRLTPLDAQIGAADPEAPVRASVSSSTEDLGWLLAPYGPADSSAAGARLIDSEKFQDDFVSPCKSWRFDGGIPSLAKRSDDLVARVRVGPGRIARKVAWDLGDRSSDYQLVLEMSGTGLSAASVAVVAEGEAVETAQQTKACALGEGEDRYAFTTLTLAPGKYRALVLSVTPSQQTGTLALHGWKLFAIPRAPEGR